MSHHTERADKPSICRAFKSVTNHCRPPSLTPSHVTWSICDRLSSSCRSCPILAFAIAIAMCVCAQELGLGLITWIEPWWRSCDRTSPKCTFNNSHAKRHARRAGDRMVRVQIAYMWSGRRLEKWLFLSNHPTPPLHNCWFIVVIFIVHPKWPWFRFWFYFTVTRNIAYAVTGFWVVLFVCVCARSLLTVTIDHSFLLFKIGICCAWSKLKFCFLLYSKDHSNCYIYTIRYGTGVGYCSHVCFLGLTVAVHTDWRDVFFSSS